MGVGVSRPHRVKPARRVYICRIPTYTNSDFNTLGSYCLNGLVRGESATDLTLHPGQLPLGVPGPQGSIRGSARHLWWKPGCAPRASSPYPGGVKVFLPCGKVRLGPTGVLGEGFLQVISRKACDLGHKPGSYDRGPSRGPSGSWCSL